MPQRHYPESRKTAHRTEENICTLYIWWESVIQTMSRTFTTHQQKDKETNFLNGQRACIDPSPDEIYKWFTSTWKDVKYFARQNSINDVRPWAVFRWWWVCALVTNLHLTLRITQIVTCQAPVHGISQARMLEWVAISFSRESFQPSNQTQVSCTTSRFFTVWAIRKAPTKR